MKAADGFKSLKKFRINTWKEKKMSGIMMLAAGAGMGILAVVLLIVSIVYRQTAGKKIREELKRDYAQSV